MPTLSEILNSIGEDKLEAPKIPQNQKNCEYCQQHKKFEVMNGYFIAQIKGDKLHFELGNYSDPFEVSPFDIDLGFCFACGAKLKKED